MRYRLWDIDVVINPFALVYGTLAAVLSAVSATTDTLVLPLLVRAVLGRDDPPPNAGIAVMIITVIFEPLRRRIKEGANGFTDWLAGEEGTGESSE